jgi:hypothetical protein
MNAAEHERDLRRADMFAAVAKRYGVRIARELQRRHGKTGDAIERAYNAALGIAGVQDVRRYLDRDRITVLVCTRACRATKKVTATGILEYAAGKWFATFSAEVAGIGGLAELLGRLEHEPRTLIIRGRLIRGRDPGRVRRLIYADEKTGDQPYFEPRRRKWLALDFDSFDLPAGISPVDLDAVAALAIARLPKPFRRATCWAQLTSGAGFKPGGRVRLFYWLSEAVDEPFLKRRLKGVRGLDHSLFCPNAPHYVAAPVFDGVADPVPLRSKLIAGEVDVVTLPAELPEPRRRAPHAAGAAAPAWPRARHPRGYMTACLLALAGAPPGQGRATCTSIALRLYGLCKAGGLDPVDVTARIKGAMLSRGWDADEQRRGETLADVNRQLQWAWQHAQPKGLD